ncbi:MAG TPA: hypothetical protein VFX22_08035, partial [Candidatus Kapabacteria bacterium]|nr:hypothetical protein [Candidatus Kapabacteria bacterium]
MVVAAPVASAQNGVGVERTTEFSRSSIGIEGGLAENSQDGKFYSRFTGGKGSGWTGSLFYQLP